MFAIHTRRVVGNYSRSRVFERIYVPSYDVFQDAQNRVAFDDPCLSKRSPKFFRTNTIEVDKRDIRADNVVRFSKTVFGRSDDIVCPHLYGSPFEVVFTRVNY